ncbi:MAG TPA: TROVE domain-containing protein [Fimbriimonadaceae bacterium]|jgi:60 kDa SS-A/Ro ribonucleoprotein
MKYSKILNRMKTPQSQPIPFSGQVPNEAGGYGWTVDSWAQLDRFLILGSENGTYYVGEQKLTMDNAKNVIEAIKQDGPRVVETIVAISREGRAPKNDPSIFALALAASFGDEKTRSAAFAAVPLVCRTGTHLFGFVSTCQGLRGWGRGMRKAVGRWYNAQDTEALTYGLIKYQSRDGWSNRDLLRLAHPKPASETHAGLYKWATAGEVPADAKLLNAVLELRNAKTPEEAARLIRENRIPREAVPTELLTEVKVWGALLEAMPLTAMLRNLGNMTKVGLLDYGSEPAMRVVSELTKPERLKKARVHPVGILAALVTYAGGKGVKGNGQWEPVSSVIDALNKAFYLTFSNVEKTGKRLVVGLDVSGSMHGTTVSGVAGLDCRKACGAMALITSAVESDVRYVAFDTNSYPMAISKSQRLDDVVEILSKTGGGGTDCALPIRYATEKRVKADAFVIYTDSQTWSGSMHPAQAMAEYRQKMGIDAKLVVVAMASTKATIGDPADGKTLNVTGFDSSVPSVISDFLKS